MKNCLILYFSQSGQSLEIAKAVTEPLKSEFNLHFEELRPVTSFPFPWKGMSFFQVFPESVMEMLCPMITPTIDLSKRFDLVILAFPVWYLSPPIPLTSFLRSEAANTLLMDTPVITIMGVRNMWAMAYERGKALISETGGKLVGNIVLNDPHPNLVSVITIVRWMMTAKKHSQGLYGKIFPPAGVPEERIHRASRFGKIILDAFLKENFTGLQAELVSNGSVKVHPVIVSIEKRAKVMFGILARWILKKGNYGQPARTIRLKVFKYYLFLVIYLVSPIASVVFRLILLFKPEMKKKLIERYTSVK